MLPLVLFTTYFTINHFLRSVPLPVLTFNSMINIIPYQSYYTYVSSYYATSYSIYYLSPSIILYVLSHPTMLLILPSITFHACLLFIILSFILITTYPTINHIIRSFPSYCPTFNAIYYLSNYPSLSTSSTSACAHHLPH